MEYALSYETATGAEQLAMILSDKVSSDVLSQIQRDCGSSQVGVLHWLKLGAHISDPFVRAKDLATRNNWLQVVIFNSSYFTISADGKVGGPLAKECTPDESTAKEWACAAIRAGDTGLLMMANAVLPCRPEPSVEQ